VFCACALLHNLILGEKDVDIACLMHQLAIEAQYDMEQYNRRGRYVPQRMAVRDEQNDVRGEAIVEEVRSNIEIFWEHAHGGAFVKRVLIHYMRSHEKV
jgi:hypothetical protein